MTPPPPTPEGAGREEPNASNSTPGLAHLLEEYLEQLELGNQNLSKKWFQNHLDLGGPLEECLATLELLHHTALSLGRGSPPRAIPAAAEPVPGRLGDYRLVRELGRGGMGVVYEAEQVSLARRVALKVLPLAGALDARQRQRFHNEARTASQLHHPHIVRVFGAGCERGVHYYAMRFIEGQTLAQLIARMRKVSGLDAADGPEGAPPEAGPVVRLTTEGTALSPAHCRAAAEIGAQVAEALDYAHEHGVVHRDIKPSNVMLDTQGQAWVTDFGLAHLQRQAHLTQSGDLLGTLRYMSPEQALARRGLRDHRTDIYALGATLYELLTLRPAVPGDDREEVLRRIASEEPAWPSVLNPALPPNLEAVVLKALAKDPEERYGTALELAEDLRRFVNDQPVQARRPTRLQQAGKWARRHRPLLLAAAAATVLMLTLAVVLLALSNAHVRLQAQEQQTRAAEREKTFQLAMARWNEARIIRQARQPGQRCGSLEALTDAVRHLRSLDRLEAHRLELRNDALAALTLWDVRPVQRHPVAPHHPVSSVDPRGRHYAYAEAANVVSYRRLADDQVVHRWQWEGSHCFHLTVSPNGRYVAALCLDDQPPPKAVCRVWDSATGRLVLERSASPRCGHDFRPDSQVLALAQADGSIALCELDSGRDLPPLPAGPMLERLRFHPSGRYLAASTWRPEVVVWDLATRTVVPLPLGDRYGRGTPAWSADGSLLAVGGIDGNICVCAFPEGTIQAVLRGHEDVITGVAFHPSGRLLASASHDDTTRLWCFSPGGELVLPGEKLLGISGDGQRLVTRSFQEITEWELEGPGDCLHYLPHGEGSSPGPWGIAFAPDGRLLASAGQDGVVLWDASTARRVGRVPSGDGFAVAFHPRECRLFTTGSRGVMQWPIGPERDGSALRVGPGRVLRPATAGGRSLRIDVAGRGEWLLVGMGDGGVDLVSLAEPGKVRRLGTHDGLSEVAFSPDGRWAATASRTGSADHPDDAVRVWDVARGTLVHRLPHEGEYPGAAFSPDGRRLVTAVRSEFSFWEVGSWERQARLRRDPRSLFSSVAFARDSSLLALVEGRTRIHLYDAAALRHLATLETPEGPANLTALSLSPDGTRLAAATDYNVIALWDLRRLRGELAALSLDW